MAVTSPVPASGLDAAIEHYEVLLSDLSKGSEKKARVALELLLVRDRLGKLIGESENFEPAVLARISALDSQLRRSKAPSRIDGSVFEELRSLVNPAKRNWWWYPRSPSPLWTVAALFVLTISVSILTDFTRRLLNSDPDEIGLLSIAVQALFAVAATSTFTTAGRASLDSFLSRLGVANRLRPAFSLWSTLALFAIVFSAWKFLPDRLADHYNNLAFKQMQLPYLARANFAKAISLNPASVLAHYNLGTLYEASYEYDKAATEYRRVIVIQPEHLKAYNNLSRLLLLDKDPAGALQVANDALKRGTIDDAEVNAALYKNRALAEYYLGLYQQGEADAKASSHAQPDAAAPYCVLAKVYGKTGQTANERRAWQDFLAHFGRPILQARVEPDCVYLAQEVLHENR